MKKKMGKKKTDNKEEGEELLADDSSSSSSTSEQGTTPEVSTEENTTRPAVDPIAMQCNNCGFYSTDLEHLKSECPTCSKELTSVYSGSTLSS